MGSNKSNRVVEGAQWGSIVSPLVSVAACVVAFWVGYASSPEFRASVWRLVDSLGRPLAAVATLAVLGVVALLVWRFWRQAVRPFKWLYLWLVRELVVRPARDDLGVLVSVDSGRGQAVLAGDFPDAVRRLSDDAAQLLRVIFRGYDDFAEMFVVWCDEVAFLSSAPSDERMRRMRAACTELDDRGFVSWVALHEHQDACEVIVGAGPLFAANSVVNPFVCLEEVLQERGLLG